MEKKTNKKKSKKQTFINTKELEKYRNEYSTKYIEEKNINREIKQSIYYLLLKFSGL